MSGKHFLTALLTTAVAVLSLAATAVSAPPPTFGTGPSTAMEMRQHILDALNGKATGFAYAIVKDGRLVVGEGVGKARIGRDGDLNMTRSSRLNVMSVTKTTTAVAILQLLDQLNLSVDSKIDPWLPAEWVKGLGMWGSNGLSFRHLLTHTSGLGQAYDTLKAGTPRPPSTGATTGTGSSSSSRTARPRTRRTATRTPTTRFSASCSRSSGRRPRITPGST